MESAAESVTTKSISSPGDHRWDDLSEKARYIRVVHASKMESLKEKFSEYKDPTSAFIEYQQKFSLPDTIKGVDNIYTITYGRSFPW